MLSGICEGKVVSKHSALPFLTFGARNPEGLSAASAGKEAFSPVMFNYLQPTRSKANFQPQNP